MGLLDKAANCVTPDSLEKIISRYHKENQTINCIFLDNPGMDNGGFCKKISDMISYAGTVIPLSKGRPLILLAPMMDRELIAHRLSRILNTAPLLSFESDSTEKAINNIKALA